MPDLGPFFPGSTYQKLIQIPATPSPTLVRLETGNGLDLPIEMSTTSVNILGSLTVNGNPFDIGDAATTLVGVLAGDGSEIIALNASTDGHVLRRASGVVSFGLLDGASIGSGTIADARLSSNIPLLNAANIFTAANRFLIGTVSAPGIALGQANTGLWSDASASRLSVAVAGVNTATFETNRTEFQGTVNFNANGSNSNMLMIRGAAQDANSTTGVAFGSAVTYGGSNTNCMLFGRTLTASASVAGSGTFGLSNTVSHNTSWLFGSNMTTTKQRQTGIGSNSTGEFAFTLFGSATASNATGVAEWNWEFWDKTSATRQGRLRSGVYGIVGAVETLQNWLQVDAQSTGTPVVTASGSWRFPQGTVASPSIAFSASPTSGIWMQDASNLRIGIAGVEVARFADTGTGLTNNFRGSEWTCTPGTTNLLFIRAGATTTNYSTCSFFVYAPSVIGPISNCMAFGRTHTYNSGVGSSHAFGTNCTVAHNHAVAIGNSLTTTRNYQTIFGSNQTFPQWQTVSVGIFAQPATPAHESEFSWWDNTFAIRQGRVRHHVVGIVGASETIEKYLEVDARDTGIPLVKTDAEWSYTNTISSTSRISTTRDFAAGIGKINFASDTPRIRKFVNTTGLTVTTLLHDLIEMGLIFATPNVLTSLTPGVGYAWYDPSDYSTLWQDTAGTVPVTANGQNVARMDDKSGNGFHLLQDTPANQFVTATDAQGVRCLSSTGAATMSSATTTMNVNSSWFASVGFVAENYNVSTSAFPIFELFVGSTIYNRINIRANAVNTTFPTSGHRSASGNFVTPTYIGYALNEKVVISGGLEAGELTNRRNGYRQQLTSSVTTTASANGLMRIAIDNSWPGRWYGGIYTDAPLTQFQRYMIDSFVAFKMGSTTF